MPDIGPIVAASIHAFFHEPHNVEVIEALIDAGIRWPAVCGEVARTTLAGQNLRDHRNPANDDTRRSEGASASVGRKSCGKRLEENNGALSLELIPARNSRLRCL